MKKLIIFITALILALSSGVAMIMVSAASEPLYLPTQNDYTERTLPDYSNMNSFCNTEQYANMQGYCGWYYCYGNYTTRNGLKYLVYNGYAGAYKGSTKSNEGMYIQKDEWQPAIEGVLAVGFKAPRSGKINANVDLELIYANGGDGIIFFCSSSKNGSKKIDGSSCALMDTIPTPTKPINFTVDVEKGEVLYFIMSAGNDNSQDLTRVKINLNYQ